MIKHNYPFPAIKDRWSSIIKSIDSSWYQSSKGMPTKEFFVRDLKK